MSPTGSVPPPLEPIIESVAEVPADHYQPRQRWWIHILLFALTLLSTTAMGARLAFNFQAGIPPLADDDFAFLSLLLRRPELIAYGLPFSITLLTILLAHEMGHYLACVFYRVDASLPYFIPAPTLIGTFGAFIRIRSPIFTRRALFDIGIAGPLAGFLFLVPAMAIGLAYSKLMPGIADHGDIIFGIPLLQRLMSFAVFPDASVADIYLHPVARAAWVGLLATALNLLPIGQLDGGHILYSFVGNRHKLLSRIFVFLLIPMGWLFSTSWFFWALFLLLFGMRHPSIYDPRPVGAGRTKLGWLALAVFILCFSFTPVRLVSFGMGQ